MALRQAPSFAREGKGWPFCPLEGIGAAALPLPFLGQFWRAGTRKETGGAPPSCPLLYQRCIVM